MTRSEATRCPARCCARRRQRRRRPSASYRAGWCRDRHRRSQVPRARRGQFRARPLLASSCRLRPLRTDEQETFRLAPGICLMPRRRRRRNPGKGIRPEFCSPVCRTIPSGAAAEVEAAATSPIVGTPLPAPLGVCYGPSTVLLISGRNTVYARSAEGRPWCAWSRVPVSGRSAGAPPPWLRLVLEIQQGIT